MKSVRAWSALVGLAAVLGTVAPAIAQAPPLLLAQGTNGRQPVDFSATPDLCSGQVVSNGRICITSLSTDQRPALRLATQGQMFTDPNLFTTTVTTLRVVEMNTNPSNVAYLVFVDDTTLPNRFSPDGFERPLLSLSVREDGAVALDLDYGEYPPQFDQQEEADRLLNVHQADIQQLITALIQTR
ncbi:MAG: hypothetical protein WBG32_06495 [Nodosilinea sp.]